MKGMIQQINEQQLRNHLFVKLGRKLSNYTKEQELNLLRLIQSYDTNDLILAQEILSC